MPKIQIDYSNTIFYKIYCIDPSINELYIGHTTNFVQRKHAHKQGCNNVKSPNYKCKLYQAMRENSGWDNWKMDIIAFHECDNLLGAKIQEQKYYEEYKATLNSIEPLPKPKPKIVKVVVKKEKSIFYCNKCNIHFDSIKTQDVHNTTGKHIKKSAIDSGEIKTPGKYMCKTCYFISSNKKDYNRHLTTRKHKRLINANKIEVLPHTQTHDLFKCFCGKKYKHEPSLYKHKKKCSMNQEQSSPNIITINESNEKNTDVVEIDNESLIKMLLKNQEVMENVILKNQEVMEKMMEIMPTNGKLFKQ